jgi:hypothetical protein
MGLFDFYTDNFYQYLVPLGPWNLNNILRPGLGYYFSDSSISVSALFYRYWESEIKSSVFFLAVIGL